MALAVPASFRLGVKFKTVTNTIGYCAEQYSAWGKYHCTIDLLFDLFELVCFANKNKKLSVVIELIPNQSNRRSTVQ